MQEILARASQRDNPIQHAHNSLFIYIAISHSPQAKNLEEEQPSHCSSPLRRLLHSCPKMHQDEETLAVMVSLND